MNIIVIGCGTIGKSIIHHVSSEGHNITIIDNDRNRVESLIEKYDCLGIVGNGASLEIQEEAKVQDADMVISVTDSDELNILACMVAKKLGTSSTIARVRNPEYRKQSIIMKEELGLSMIINPEQETAEEIFKIIEFPSISKMEQFAKGRVNLIELPVNKATGLVGQTLYSMSKIIKTKVLVCAVVRGEKVIIPKGNFKFEDGDRIHVTADANSLSTFLKELSIIKTPIKNVLIIGGGKISYYLAQRLNKHFNIKIIENNVKRAEELAEQLENCTIINGDGTSHDLLLEEGIKHSDAVIALTNVDEENIIVSLYAQKLGITKVIAKVKRDSLINMMSDLGLNNVITPKEIVANKIISYLRAVSNKRGSNVITLYKLVNNHVEALEFLAKKREKYIDVPLRDLKIKDNCLIGCIIRNNKVIIPNGNDYISLNDSVLIVTTHKNFDDLADIFE